MLGPATANILDTNNICIICTIGGENIVSVALFDGGMINDSKMHINATGEDAVRGRIGCGKIWCYLKGKGRISIPRSLTRRHICMCCIT